MSSNFWWVRICESYNFGHENFLLKKELNCNDDAISRALVQELENFQEFIGGQIFTPKIIPLFEKLCYVDDTVTREKRCTGSSPGLTNLALNYFRTLHSSSSSITRTPSCYLWLKKWASITTTPQNAPQQASSARFTRRFLKIKGKKRSSKSLGCICLT